MNENLDLTKILEGCPKGVRIGKLTIIQEVERVRHPNGKTSRRFECKCDCGNITYPKTKNGKNYRCHNASQLACEHFERKEE